MNKKITEKEYKEQLFKDLYGGILARMRNIRTEMRRHFWGKDYEYIIDNILIAAMAGQPILLIGKPGFAKSLIMTTFFSLIGLNKIGNQDGQESIHTSKDKFFQYLLHSFTMPDEILGAVDIKEFLQHTNFVRKKAGSIIDPCVKAAFLDEIFNANSTILNSLLSIINEKEFYEGGVAYRSNLFIIAGASNKVPNDKELLAFFDRFPVRLLVETDLNKAVDANVINEHFNRTQTNEEDLDLELDVSNDETDSSEINRPEISEIIDDPVFMRIIDQGVENIKNRVLFDKKIASHSYLKPKNQMPSLEDFQNIHDFIVTHYLPRNSSCFGKNTKKTILNLVQYLQLPMYNTCSLNGRKLVKLFMLSAASSILRVAIDGSSDEAFEVPKIEISDLHVFKNIWDVGELEFIEQHKISVDNILNGIDK